MTIDEFLRRVDMAKELLRLLARAEWDHEDSSVYLTFAATLGLRLRTLAANVETN